MKPNQLNKVAMKRVTITIVVALLAFTMSSLESESKDIKGSKKIVPITIQRAVQIPGLVIAMYQQLNPAVLKNNQHFYILKVKYELNIYEISGTYDQWVRFFSMKWKCPVNTQKPAVAN